MAVKNLPFVDLVSIRMSVWFADFKVHNPSSAKPKGRRSACSRTKDMAAGAIVCVSLASLSATEAGHADIPISHIHLGCKWWSILSESNCAVLDDLHAARSFLQSPLPWHHGIHEAKGLGNWLAVFYVKSRPVPGANQEINRNDAFFILRTPHLSTALSSHPPPRLSTTVILSPCRGPHVSSAEVSLLDHVEDSTRSAWPGNPEESSESFGKLEKNMKKQP